MPSDIGIGLLLGIFINHVSELNYSLCLFLGVTACLLPDLDFLWPIIKSKSLPDGSHRDGLHYPLLFTPVISAMGLIFDPYIAVLLGLGSIFHFLHDSIGLGWGVKWLYPFTKNAYVFLYQVGLPTNTHMPRKWFYSFSDRRRDKMQAQYGDPDWIKHIYFRPHVFGIFEYLIFLIGVFAALMY